ncbi:MAG: ribosome biogenesis GTPase Der [Deltaproteobacteria bacterium]|nr:ribosome biogenesis GTPase Der [Deltaproteobacteria bacterium]
MIPTIAIVGRPNVGKSTLFNRLTGRRGAIVENTPGVTRDRNYGEGEILNRKVIVVDTGGFEPETDDQMLVAMREQAEIAMDDADVILCVFDGPAGPLPQDHDIVRLLDRLRTTHGKPVFWVVNKIDGVRHEQLVPEFYELGVDELFPVSAQHANGILDLIEAIDEVLPPAEGDDEVVDANVIRVAIVGRPNVGKSTLLNRLIGEERMIVSNVPGTTRDSIDTRWERKLEDGTIRQYLLIDTAGVRRRKWIRTTVEKISIVRTFKSIDRAQVCLLVVDATEGVNDQDARLAGLISDKGRACVILLNKWDAIGDKDNATFGEHIKAVQDKLDFIKWAPIVTISGLTGQRTHKIMAEVDHAWQSYHRRVPTGELNRVFEQILHVHQPPVIKNRRLKLYYATQVQVAPPVFILWCNDPEGLHFSYKRFLVNRFREHWDFTGTPIKMAARARNRRSPAPVDDTAREQETTQLLVAQPLGEADWEGDRLVEDEEPLE